MDCKFCGDTIDDNSMICNSCGKSQRSIHGSGDASNQRKSDISPSYFRMIIINTILAWSYYTGWIKLTGHDGKASNTLYGIFGSEFSEISPRRVMEGFDYIKETLPFLSGSFPLAYYLLYLLMAIPLLSGFGIILSLFKMKAAVSVGKLNAFISLVCQAYAWYLATQANISASLWLYIFTAISIYFFFVLRNGNAPYEACLADD